MHSRRGDARGGEGAAEAHGEDGIAQHIWRHKEKLHIWQLSRFIENKAAMVHTIPHLPKAEEVTTTVTILKK